MWFALRKICKSSTAKEGYKAYDLQLKQFLRLIEVPKKSKEMLQQKP